MTTRIEIIKTATLVNFYNELADKPVKKFKDRATAEKRTLDLIAESGFMLKINGEDDAELVQLPQKKARTVWTDDVILDVNAFTNPKRKNSASYKRFELYKAGMTVGEYLDACVAHDGENAKPRYRYLADIRWDVERGFIGFAGEEE